MTVPEAAYAALQAENAQLRQRIAELERSKANEDPAEQQGTASTVSHTALPDRATLTALLEQIPLPMALFDSAGGLIALNNRIDHLFGTSRTSLPAAFNILQQPEARRGRYVAAFQQALQGTVSSLPATVGGPSHQPADSVSEVYVPLADGQGVVQFIGILRLSLATPVHTQTVLDQSPDLLQHIIDHSPAIIHVKDLDGRYIIVNHYFAAAMNLSREQMLGKTDYDLFAARFAQGWYASDQQVVKSGEPIKREELVPLANGLRTLFIVKFPIYNVQGNMSALAVIATDITEHKHVEEMLRRSHIDLERLVRERTARLLQANESLQREIAERKQVESALRLSEERYRTLFNAVPVGLYRTTAEGKILDVNQSVCDLLGYPDRETLLAEQAPDQYVYPEERARWQQLMEQHEVVTDFEVQWRRCDGGIIWVLDHARGIRDSRGNLLFYEGMVKDITARKEQQQTLRLQRNLALALSSAPDQDTALQCLLNLVLEIEGMTGGGAYLVEPDTGAVQMVVHQGFTPEFAAQVSYFAPDTFEAHLVATGTPHIQEGDTVPARYRQQGWHSVAIIPIRYENQPIAVLTVGSTSQPVLPAALTASLETIQEQVGSVLARLQAEAAVRERDALLEAFYNTADIGMCVTDEHGHFVKVNRAYCAIYQREPEELIGQHFTMMLPAENREYARWIHDAFIDGAPESAGEWVGQRRDGTLVTIHVTAGLLVLPDGRRFKVTTVADITEQKERDAQIEHLAFTDQLTNLPNRNQLYKVGKHMMSATGAYDRPVALLYIDINRLKVINDTLGYAAGDEFLVYVATRLKHCMPTADLLARVGGDEFVVLFDNTSTDQAVRVTQELLNCRQNPATLRGEMVYFNSCIGISGGQVGSIPFSQMLAQAENAMYRAKMLGRRVEVYNPVLSPRLQSQLQLENELRSALEDDTLTLYFQPVFNLQANRIVMVEALVRWLHPTRGVLSPGVFLPMAEELRLIDTLDLQVIRKALHQTAAWEAAGYDLAVSVNISAPSLQNPELVDEIAVLLRETRVSPARIILEVTEHSALRDLPISQQVLANLRLLGLRVALDDFGTGHASLTHLRHLPVDILKLDRAFASGIGHNMKDEAVIQTLLALGQGLDLDVVVEGIEHTDQLEWLQRVGCSFIQGYLLGKPAPETEIDKLLQQQEQPRL